MVVKLLGNIWNFTPAWHLEHAVLKTGHKKVDLWFRYLPLGFHLSWLRACFAAHFAADSL